MTRQHSSLRLLYATIGIFFAAALPAWGIVLNDQYFEDSGGDLEDPAVTSVQGYSAARAYSLSEQFLSAGRIETPAGACTATWLGYDASLNKSFFLTAAHCFDSDPPMPISTITLLFEDWQGLTRYNGSATAYLPPERINIPAGLGDQSTDIALLEVPGQVTMLDDSGDPIAQPRLYYGDKEVGKVTTLLGYGTRGLGSIGANVLLNSSDNRAAGTNLLDAPFLENDRRAEVSFEEPGEEGFQTDEATAAPGDSGSAWWQQHAGDWTVTTVASGVSGTTYGNITAATRVSPYMDWIEGIFSEVHTLDKPVLAQPAEAGGVFFTDPSKWIGGEVPDEFDRAVFKDYAAPGGGAPGLVKWAGSNTTTFGLQLDNADAEFVTTAGNPVRTHTTREDATLLNGSTLRLGRAGEGLNLVVNEQLNIESGSSLQLVEGDLSAGTLAGGGTIHAATAGRTITLGASGEDATFAGAVTKTAADGADVYKIGDGHQTLGGSLSVRRFQVRQGAVTLDGLGAMIVASGLATDGIRIGDSGNDDGTLTVKNGAILGAERLDLAVFGDSSGTLILEGAGTTAVVSNQVFVGFQSTGQGRLVVKDGATLDSEPGRINIADGSRVELDGGTINTRGLALLPGGTLQLKRGVLNIKGGHFGMLVNDFTLTGADGAVTVSLLDGATTSINRSIELGGAGRATFIVGAGTQLSLSESVLVNSDGGFSVKDGGEATVLDFALFGLGNAAGATVVGAGSVLNVTRNLNIGNVDTKGFFAVGNGGSVVADRVDIASESLLLGDGTISHNGEFNNAGTITPFPIELADGQTSYSLTIDGGYGQAPEGTLALLATQFVSTSLNVVGSAFLGGELNASNKTDGLAIGSVALGESYTLLSASGGVFGEFDTETIDLDLSAFLQPRVVYTPDEVLLVISPLLDGDYNADGVVDTADFTVWRDSLGSTTNLAADGNGDLMVTTADYQVWRDHFGETAPASPIGVNAPEPASALVALLAAMLVPSRSRRMTTLA